MREEPPRLQRRVNDQAISLAREWKVLGRAATVVALLTSPALFALFYGAYGWPLGWSLLATLAGVVIFRGGVDVIAHKLIPMPAIYGSESALKENDVITRRRVWYWRHKFKVWFWVGLILLIVLWLVSRSSHESIADAFKDIPGAIPSALGTAAKGSVTIMFLFLINFVILFGPMVGMGIQQIKTYEPGDADWGVKLDDVRGQFEAKQEITRVVSLWQSGEEFEKAGGKRERGVLFLGAPGTGKTMLSKAIATSFNCPFVTIPGSGFAQTFIGMDAIIVRFLSRKAKKMANKWGGQCIVFIDEIDAVGMRRSSLGTGFQPLAEGTIHDNNFFGPWGAINPSGDLVRENEAWREKLFAMRAEPARPLYPPIYSKLNNAIRNAVIPGMGGMGGMGGGLALNQLLVVMDGIDEPPFFKRFRTRKFNAFLDATYLVPQRLFGKRLRLKPPKPRKEEVYFIGACNAPLQALDPALTRPGRMGRHIYFRTPTWEDRRDIFDLYLDKVAHEETLDTPKARDELARITNGYSPAMIDQACSLALTYAHSADRAAFARADLLEAMTTVETGVAIGQQGPKHELRAIAVHEAGHAVTSHLFEENVSATRLSIKKRGSTGGHYMAMATEDRFNSWRSEQVGDLICGLGAMAAELVFYGQTTNGVGGDLYGATAKAAAMVGAAGMAPSPIDLSDRIADKKECEEAEKEVIKRFEELGSKLMHRSGALDVPALGDRDKRRMVTGLLGQSFVIAFATIKVNRDATDRIAERLLAELELYGDDVTDMLDEARLSEARNRRPGRIHMARDLIPPPSPAGIPTAPDGAPRLIELPPEPPRSGAQPAMVAQEPTGPSQFRNRFGFLLGSLAGVCVAAALVVVAILVTNNGDSNSTAGLAKNWSRWKPDDTSLQGGPAEIAQKVGAEYKQGNGKQLVLVEPQPVDNLHVALSPSSGNIAQLTGTGVVYNLNGLGTNGSILGGTPSPARLQVIQREALELALYTFRYLPDVDMVVTLPAASAAELEQRQQQCQQRRGERHLRHELAHGHHGLHGHPDGPGMPADRAVLSPGRSQAVPADPARRDGLIADADAGHARRRRGQEDRVADRDEQVPMVAAAQQRPAGAEPSLKLKPAAPPPHPDHPTSVGLCGGCAHQRVIANTRGSTFSMCERGLAHEPGFAKYPRLPVLACAGFEPRSGDDPASPGPRGGASPAA